MTIIIENEEHWHKLRAAHGGSSEAAALFGIGYQDMPSAWSLWALHSGKAPPPQFDDDELSRIWFGKKIEPVIAEAVARKTGWTVRHAIDPDTAPRDDLPAVYVECPTNPRLGCTVDRYIVEHEDGDGILEIKNRDYLQWSSAYTDERAGARDLIQLAHQLICHPWITWGMVAVLVGGNDLKTYRYTRADLAEQIAGVEAAWAEHWRRVDEGDEPSPTGDELPAWLQTHIDDINVHRGDTIRLDGAADMLDDTIAAYVQADNLAKTAAKDAKAARAAIVERLGGAGIGRTNQWDVRATYVERKPGACKACGAQTSKGSVSVRLKIESVAGYNEADDPAPVSIIDAG